MKKYLKFMVPAAMIAVLGLAVAGCGGAGGLGGGGKGAKGPIADKVIFDVRMDQTIAMKDTAEGKTDIFFTGVDSKIYRALSKEDKEKLDTYAVPSGSWSLEVNPIPNAAPYIVKTKDGKTFFNPMAIADVRYALNWLIDRKKIVDEILLGDGDPAFTAMTPGQPGTYKYNLIAAKLGMADRGNEQKAIADIDAAMKKAAELPENKGKLAKTGQFWTYAGKEIILPFLIRVDDPTGRLLEGRYIADQLEKAGFKVDRLEYDRSKCFKILDGDPADYQWSFYTEGWGAGATRAWWDVSVCQMYAPWYGYMPGGGVEGFWNYQNKEIDELSTKSMNGWFQDSDEYWKLNLRATELGVRDSVRVYICSQKQYYVTNKARFNSRFAYGLGDGLNRWSIVTADVKPEKGGQRVLHVTQYSAKGGLFMSAWDPIGVDGFSDVYSGAIVEPCGDSSTFEAPNSALDTPLRVKWDLTNVETKIQPDANGDGKPDGLIAVDPESITYNSRTKAWEKGLEYKDVGEGKFDYVKNDKIMAYSKATMSYLYGKWHSGQPITLADVMYASAFAMEWANKDGEGDKMYDETYASQFQPLLATSKGSTIVNNGESFTNFFDFNWPMDKNRVASTGAVTLKTGNPGRPSVVVSWEISETLAKLVAEGSKSGTVYSFSQDPALTEVDVIAPACLADIKAKLQEMLDAKYVPSCIQQWVKPEDAVARYKAALEFIEKNGNAYISNGPYYISKVDYNANYIELSAFRDATYPYTGDYWPKAFQMNVTRIDGVTLPPNAQRTKDAVIDVAVSQLTYPIDKAVAGTKDVKVTITLIDAAGKEKAFAAKFVKDGSFKATLPAADLGALAAGTYTVVVESKLADEAPAIVSGTLPLN
ncbi:MAG: ABC transporter substrate-binding protein [Spirochaetes bacterium]|nr:ABC transporter substrate-binding protein [Spirochaetota bacterium]